MAKRSAMVITLVMLAISASPKEKREIVPALILRAQYVAVIVDPEAGISVANPGENGIARSDVEAALEKWGRFKLTVNPENADLVVVVRKGGKAIKPTIGGIGNGPPVVWNPGSTGDVTIGVGRTSPPYSTPADPRESQRPTARTEVGFPDDVFSVYPARVDVRDASPLWRYIAHDGLQHPTVPAVQKFRKAIEEAEKTRKP